MTQATQWQDVITISSAQSKESQDLCRDVLNFWQEREPKVFERIRETANYRNGAKIEFGINIDPPELQAWAGDVSHFAYYAKPPYVNISSDQIQNKIMLDKTGTARRGTLEDTAYHELCHVGDSEYLERIKAAGVMNKFENLRGGFNQLIEDCLKSEASRNNPDLQKSLLAIQENGKTDDFNHYIAARMHFKQLDIPSFPQGLPDRMRNISIQELALQKFIQKVSPPGGVEEERVTQQTDTAMQTVDSDYQRKVYKNAADASQILEVALPNKTPSYVRHTVRELIPQIDFKGIFSEVELGAATLKDIAKGKVLERDNFRTVDEALFRSTRKLNHLAGTGQHEIFRPETLLKEFSVSLPDQLAANLKQEADSILAEKTACEKSLETLTKTLKAGDKDKIREAKLNFAKAMDNMLEITSQTAQDLKGLLPAKIMEKHPLSPAPSP